jgi:hypothetical protein
LRDEPRADLGDLCDRAGIEHRDFLAEVTRELFPVMEEAKKFAHALSAGVVAKRLPKVVERGMIEAAKADGIADRHFIMQKEGFHIVPKGTNIQLQQVNQQAAGLPIFEDEVKDMAAALADEEVASDLLLGPGERDYIDTSVEEDETLESVP